MDIVSQASKGGLMLAQRIAPCYFENPRVTAAILGGSAARGCADEYSDLEIGVFWAEPPSDAERRTAIERTGGDLWKFEPYPPDTEGAAFEHLGLTTIEIGRRRYEGTSMISVQHLTAKSVQTCFADVIDHCDTSIHKQSLISAIQHSVPLHGAPVVAQWQAKAATYPHELARKMVQENLWLGPWFYPEAYAARDDRLVLNQHFCHTAQRLLNVLLGLNRVYHPSAEYKWMHRLAGRMQIAPPDLASRLKRVFHADLLAGGRELLTLVHQTLSLIERHMPEIDTSRERKRWEPCHPYTLLQEIGAGEG